MTWDNHGEGWHVDHIIPQVNFSYTSLDDPAFLECWSLANLRPLASRENLRKGGRIEE